MLEVFPLKYSVLRQQRFQILQIVAVYDFVATSRRRPVAVIPLEIRTCVPTPDTKHRDDDLQSYLFLSKSV